MSLWEVTQSVRGCDKGSAMVEWKRQVWKGRLGSNPSGPIVPLLWPQEHSGDQSLRSSRPVGKAWNIISEAF